MTEIWFGVRCVVRHSRLTTAATTTFEERITVWRAESFDDAIRLAEAEAADYAAAIGGENLGLAQAFELDREPRQGSEVFSLLRDSPLDPHDYLDRFFDTGGERQQHASD